MIENLIEPLSQEHAHNVLKKFRLIYGTVKQQFRDIEQRCGISGSQLWLLQEINHSPNIGVSVLAERLSIHQSTCSLLVEKLVTRKLITKQRSVEDQRRVGLCATPAGVEILAKAPGPAEGVLPDALKSLPDDVLINLEAALGKVIEQLHVRNSKLSEQPLSDL